MTDAYALVPLYPLVFPLFWGAAVVFGLVIARHLRVFAAARVAGPSPLDRLPQRLWMVVRYALIQTRMFRDRSAGLMHAGIFWGFVFLTIGTADIVTGGLIRAIVRIPLDGLLWVVVTVLQNVVAIVVLGAIGWAFYRRLVSRPARLTYTTDALVILAMIGGVVATELLAQAFEAAAYGDVPGAVVANAIAVPLGSFPGPALEAGFTILWWAHMVLVAAFLVYLPFSKHLHIVTAVFNAFFRKLEPRGLLPAMDLENGDATFGVRTIVDLSWKDLLDGFTCTECGRCQDACPAWNTGKPLNPKTFVMGLRDMAVDAEAGISLIPNSPIVRETYGLDDTHLSSVAVAEPIVDTAIPFDAVWDCVTCGACVEACPVLIEHVDKIVGLRRNLVLEDANFPPELAPAFRNMEGPGNPWGQPRSTRLDWTRGLSFEVRTVADVAAVGGLDELEVIYWVGCAAAFDERNKKVARAVATCLDAAGVRFAVLGQEESCTGDPARRMGNDYVYQMLAMGNIETLQRYRAGDRTIVTACPHCFTSIGTEYAQLGGSFRVQHHSTYLAGLVAEGRLAAPPMEEGSGPTVTLHDPCYLARYNGITGAPRDILAAAGGELVEMERHGRQTFCCGAGGGRMWMEEQRGTRINAERTRQALATGADIVATACPFCMVMMKDGLADARSDVVALDVSELLAARIAAAPVRSLPVV
ncbi:MAG TPA: (Fe-S)-binding protein [Candidatus Limnocylindrales bacterium]|nr:(Fe-S)-binding protein [Candidatus Limnocylindrales bacterium]